MATEIVGSNLPSFASDALKPDSRGYGQNGFGGSSSDTPGQNTCAPSYSGAETDSALAIVKDRGLKDDSTLNQQLEKMSAKNVPAHPSMSSPNADSIGSLGPDSRPVVKRD